MGSLRVVIALGVGMLAGCGRVGFDEHAGDAVAPPLVTLALAPAPFETTSTQFADVPDGTVIVPPSPGQRWLLLVSGSLQSTSLEASAAEARYLVDGVERGLGGTESVIAGKPGPWQHVYVFDGADRPLPITLQLRDARAATARLDDAHLVVVPLPATDTATTASADAPLLVPSSVLAPVLTLDLAVPTAGDYVVALLLNATEAPSASNIEWQWRDPGGQPWSPVMQNPRDSWQATLFLRAATLPAGTATVTLLARSSATATLQYARAVALRLADFPVRAFQARAGAETTTTPTPLVVNELMPALVPAPAYLVLGTMQVDDLCGGGVADRGAYVRIDADERTTQHLSGNCALKTSYGLLDLRTQAPSVVALGFSAGNGIVVEHVSSSLLVLGVP